MKILLPTSITLDEEKLGLEPGDTVRHYNPVAPIAEEDTDAEVLIAWANTADQLADSARRMKNVGLIQALLAGPDAVRAAGFTPDAAICAGVGLHSKTVAEHALALTLNFVRFLPTLAQATAEHRWAEELGGAQELHPKDQVTTLLDANVLVWGFGSIGQETARLFKAFGANVTGVAQSAGERSGFPVIATEQIDEYLPTTDILVMVLPTSDSTFKALDAHKLQLLPKRAYLVNVGRGTTVDEDALVAALNSGSIAGAALDVTATEPLPSDSPLWDAKNIVITPHAAGGRPVNPEELIAHNIRAFRTGAAASEYRNRF